MIYVAICALVFLLGVFLPVDALGDPVAPVVTWFFGILGASFLPTIALVVGGALEKGQSVARIDELQTDIENLVKSLFAVFIYIVVGGIALMLSVYSFPDLPLPAGTPGTWYADQAQPFLVQFPHRLAQASAVLAFFISLDRLNLVWEAFSLVSKSRYQLIRNEAQEDLLRATPKPEEIAEAFSTDTKHGTRARLGEDT